MQFGGRRLKYFTEDWFKEMQICGLLAFPDSKEQWDSFISYIEEEAK